MNKPRVYCTEWGKSQREKQISYIITYIWNLENTTDELICKVNRDAAIGNMRTQQGEGERQGMNWENSIEIYTLLICPTMFKISN